MCETFKILVLGWKSVGKSSLINTLLFNEDLKSDKYATLAYRKYFIFEGQQIAIDFLDFSQEIYNLPKEYIQNSHGVIFVFSLLNEKSFDKIEEFQIKVFIEKLLPFVLLGNQSDLANQRKITLEMVKKQYGTENYFETSKNSPECTLSSVYHLITQIKKKQPQQKISSKRFCCCN